MRCSICRRVLLRQAVPGLQIGPKCAQDRGLLPPSVKRPKLFEIRKPRRRRDDGQIDWINDPPTPAKPEKDEDHGISEADDQRLEAVE